MPWNEAAFRCLSGPPAWAVSFPSQCLWCQYPTEHSPAPSMSRGCLEAPAPLGTSIPLQHPRLPGELSAGSTCWVLWSTSQIPSSHTHSLLQIRFSSLIVQRFKSTLTPKYMHSHTEVKHQVRHIHEAFEKPVKARGL